MGTVRKFRQRRNRAIFVFKTSYDSTVTIAYVVTYLKTPYGVCEKFLVNNRTAPIRRPYNDDTVSVRVLRAPYWRCRMHLTEHLRFHG